MGAYCEGDAVLVRPYAKLLYLQYVLTPSSGSVFAVLDDIGTSPLVVLFPYIHITYRVVRGVNSSWGELVRNSQHLAARVLR